MLAGAKTHDVDLKIYLGRENLVESLVAPKYMREELHIDIDR